MVMTFEVITCMKMGSYADNHPQVMTLKTNKEVKKCFEK